MNPNPDRPTLLQAACLLLASAGLGLAGNALHPAGLRWADSDAGRGLNEPVRNSGAAVYRNETVYENETVTPAPKPSNAQGATRAVPSTPVDFATDAATPLRSTWAEVKPLVESGQLVLVDARARTAYDAGHIPSAVCLPFKSLQVEIKAFMSAYPPATPLAIYCANANCAASSQLATALTRTYKYRNVRYLPGGYQEWRNAEGK